MPPEEIKANALFQNMTSFHHLVAFPSSSSFSSSCLFSIPSSPASFFFGSLRHQIIEEKLYYPTSFSEAVAMLLEDCFSEDGVGNYQLLAVLKGAFQNFRKAKRLLSPESWHWLGINHLIKVTTVGVP